MLSRVQICNMALLSIGTRTVASLDENTPEATYCNQHYDLAVEEALRDFPWNFAQARKSLAQVPMPETWRREYPYAYAYPGGCLHLHTLIDQAGRPSQEFTVAQEGGTDQGIPLVMTHIEQPIAAYTELVTDPARFDPLFARALSAKLACHVAPCILKGNAQVVQLAEKNYTALLAKAKTADAREGKPYACPDSEWNGGHDNPWIAARMGCYTHRM